jgi:hypothetical protein
MKAAPGRGCVDQTGDGAFVGLLDESRGVGRHADDMFGAVQHSRQPGRRFGRTVFQQGPAPMHNLEANLMNSRWRGL